jgi:hypothetical protein
MANDAFRKIVWSAEHKPSNRRQCTTNPDPDPDPDSDADADTHSDSDANLNTDANAWFDPDSYTNCNAKSVRFANNLHRALESAELGRNWKRNCHIEAGRGRSVRRNRV